MAGSNIGGSLSGRTFGHLLWPSCSNSHVHYTFQYVALPCLKIDFRNRFVGLLAKGNINRPDREILDVVEERCATRMMVRHREDDSAMLHHACSYLFKAIIDAGVQSCDNGGQPLQGCAVVSRSFHADAPIHTAQLASQWTSLQQPGGGPSKSALGN